MRPSIPSLTSLRFVAALFVVIFHYKVSDIGSRRLDFPEAISSFGYEAVTFFFVLSGFILTYVHVRADSSIQQLNVSARSFFASRLARILPAYFIALAIAAPFFVRNYFAASTPDTLLFASGLVLVPLLLQAWYPPANLLWNAPAWSLSVELFFYAVYPAFTYALRRCSNVRFFFGSLAVVLAIGALRQTLASEAWQNFWAYSPLVHLPQFVFGAALARLFVFEKPRSPLELESMMATAILLLIPIIAYKPEIAWLANSGFLAVVFGIVIFGAAGARGPLTRILSADTLVLLGEASYALYIMHWPMLVWWRLVTRKYLTFELSPIVDFVCYLALAMCLSVLIFLYVERPMRRYLFAKLAEPAGKQALEK